MIGILLSIVAALLGGVGIGIIVIVAVGIRREERDSTLTFGTTDRVCLGTRQLTGTHVRMPNSSRDYQDQENLWGR